jgi:hypothetical protein
VSFSDIETDIASEPKGEAEAELEENLEAITERREQHDFVSESIDI